MAAVETMPQVLGVPRDAQRTLERCLLQKIARLLRRSRVYMAYLTFPLAHNLVKVGSRQ